MTTKLYLIACVALLGACADSNTPAGLDAAVAGSGGGSAGGNAGTGGAGGSVDAGSSGVGASGGAGSGGAAGGAGASGAGAGGGGAGGAGSGGAGVSGGGVGGSGGVDAGPASTCELDFEPGPCRAAINVYWYDAARGSCQKRTYGGCEGNDNRFDTLEACQDACVDASDIACDSDDDCGWGEIGHDILAPSDCLCLFGCPYIPLNKDSIARRLEQHTALCDPQRDGSGQPCPIDDCAIPSPAMCVGGKCTGDPFGGF